MYSIDGLCPSGRPLGGYGFCIHLAPEFRDAVKTANVTQEQADRVIKIYGQEWLQKCGLCGYYDPDNSGWDAKDPAIPGKQTKLMFGGTGLRISWGEWGPEHIAVPGNACGLDIDHSSLGNPFDGGVSLLPHNIDHWGQVCALLITFTWFAHFVIMEHRLAKVKSCE